MFNHTDVLIEDLSSRNGTVVSEALVPPESPCLLSHHDWIKIGKYTLRVSIRDELTNKPYHPQRRNLSTVSGLDIAIISQGKGAAQLLNELEDLASQLKSRRKSERLESDNEPRALDAAEVRGGVANPPSAKRSREVNAGHEDLEPSTVLVGDDVDAENSGVNVAATPKANGKIPDHLKPKGPKDSQSAAAKALKNLFVR